MQNSTEPSNPVVSTDTFLYYFQVIFNVGFLFPVLTFSNGLIVLAVITTPHFRSLTYLHICNVAVADFGVGLGALLSGAWPMCSMDGAASAYYIANTTCSYSAAMASLLCLLLLAIDRLVYIVYPFVYIKPRTAKLLKFAMAAAWGLSIFSGTMPLLLWGSSTGKCIIGSVDLDYYHSAFPGIFLPVSVISTACYLKIIAVSRDQQRRVAQSWTVAGHKVILPSKAKSITVFFLINTVFVLCWIPFTLDTIISTCEYRSLQRRELLFCIGNFSSVLNVLLYSWKSKEMRKIYRRLLCCGQKQETNCPGNFS
ncbi:hypothetical protein C0Q70_18900 [Pomacea canaliculata]|uniref:G-protein coupled receptors family 1 profile domain-containing protein n=1 Tax=Pomacea canaliculata TaxID=400727 RepID=A0A2T7NHT4_POMCA|nr:hypothetical protein C0Q70_18900 [Pomacea canaliculata]